MTLDDLHSLYYKYVWKFNKTHRKFYHDRLSILSMIIGRKKSKLQEKIENELDNT